MTKRAYSNVATPKYCGGFDKLSRIHEDVANQMVVGGSDSSICFDDEDDDDDPIVGMCSNVDYDNLAGYQPPPARPYGSQEQLELFQQLLQLEEDEADNEVERLLESDLNNDDESTIDATAHNSNLPLNAEIFSVTDHAMVELIQCCNQARTPIKFLDELLGILKRHTRQGFDIQKAPKRSNFMARWRERIPCPKATPIISPSGVLIPKYSLHDQLEDLLSSDYFQDLQCCAVNRDPLIRFQQYIPPEEEGIGEVLGANWYRRTYREKIGDSPTYVDITSGKIYHNWLFPICVYNDKTGVGAMEGKYTLEPLMISTTVIRRDYRQKDDAWRHLGFIPNYHHVTKEEEKENGAAKSVTLFHEILGLLLGDLADLQNHPPLMTLNLFREEVNVRPILVVAFVMGDQLSQDQHCARKKSNSGGASRVHRACMSSFISACRVDDEQCHPLEKLKIETLYNIIKQGEDPVSRGTMSVALYPFPDGAGRRDPRIAVAKKERISFESWLKLRSTIARHIYEKMYGMYPIENAWSKICFGSNVNGIYRATLDDPMHYSSSGMFMYLANVSFKGLLPSEAKKVEKYMREDFSNRCSVRYDFPRGKFSPGFTNCTLLTSNEKVGLMFALYLCLGTKRIADIFEQSIARQQGKYLDIESCYSNLGYSQSSVNRPAESKLPRLGDKYFYSDVKLMRSAERSGRISDGYQLPRTMTGARRIVEHLDSFGLLFVLKGDSPLDELQAEYLAKDVWFHSARKDHQLYAYDLSQIAPELNHDLSECADDVDKLQLTKLLLSTLRKGSPPFLYTSSKGEVHNRGSLTGISASGTTGGIIRKKIKKHFIDKPQVKGRGETSAILTDVAGWRRVLEHALVFHAIVHEHHHLHAITQKDRLNFDSKVSKAVTLMTDGFYRGDNSVDMGTCKVHAHLHLSDDCREYGSPMNYDAALGERGLKFWAKGPSRSARKCGEATFITQTSCRVSDQQLLSKIRRSMQNRVPQNTTETANESKENMWKFTRRGCHMLYNLLTKIATTADQTEGRIVEAGASSSSKLLLLPQIIAILHSVHGNCGLVEIWKEVDVYLGTGKGVHHIRAYAQYDVHGPYFDWVNVRDSASITDMHYVPAKVLLLYRFNGEGYCICWKALTPTATERRQETNISARWKMQFHANGLPALASVPLSHIDQTIYVYQHFHNLPYHFPQEPVAILQRSSHYIIDEAYERYSWALNYLDQQRWVDESSY